MNEAGTRMNQPLFQLFRAADGTNTACAGSSGTRRSARQRTNDGSLTNAHLLRRFFFFSLSNHEIRSQFALEAAPSRKRARQTQSTWCCSNYRTHSLFSSASRARSSSASRMRNASFCFSCAFRVACASKSTTCDSEPAWQVGSASRPTITETRVKDTHFHLLCVSRPPPMMDTAPSTS